MTQIDERPSQGDFPVGIGQPALRALHSAGCTRMEDLTHLTEAEVLKLHGMGPKAMGILRNALHAGGLSFKPK